MQLRITLTDPYLNMNFGQTTDDGESICDLIHTLLVGKPPMKLKDGTVIFDTRAENSDFMLLMKHLRKPFNSELQSVQSTLVERKDEFLSSMDC